MDEKEEKSTPSRIKEKQKLDKKQKRRLIKLIIFGTIAVALVVVILNWQTIFAPLKGIFLPVGNGGFPVALPGSAAYEMGTLDGNFYLLTDTYLYTYTGGGAEIASIQHGFNKPASSVRENRVLVYDKNAKDLKIFSKSDEIISKTMEDPIVFAEMGSGGRSAVVTTSTRYSNYLYIFGADGSQLFRWASPNEKIMRVCFADNGNYIYVSVVGEKDGELRCAVLCFDITSDAGEVWRTSTGNSVSYSLKYCSDGVYTVTERGAYVFNKNNGDVLAQNIFTKQVTGVCDTKNLRIVIFHDSASNGKTAVLYDEKLEETALMPLDGTSKLTAEGSNVYVLSEKRLAAYDNKFLARKTYELSDDYSDVIVFGGKAVLLGYNTVVEVKL